jgi:Protein of unknown function DUF262
MHQLPIAPYPISDFLEWEFSKQLELTPKFQRRDVWSAKAKSFLIDTIIRQMPIPPIFLRLKLDPVKRKMVREVVDGQQRLRAILGFVQGDFPIMKAHNAEFANANYSELPDELQRTLLAYKLPVYSLENISDADVLRIFARMNTYTEPLKAQELLNAEFFGAFKQAVYELAFNHYSFWINCNILTTKKMARMADAELVSELIVCILDGIRQTKTADLRQFYARYDDEFPLGDRVTREFNAIIDVIGNAYADKLPHSPFRRIPLFFTLFLVVYDAMYGLPNSRFELRLRQVDMEKTLRANLDLVSNQMARPQPSREYSEFIELSQRATADPGRRRDRHEFLFGRLFVREVATA